MTEFVRYVPSSVAEHTVVLSCATIKAQHHRLILNLMGQRFSERFSSNKRVSQKCFAILPANKCTRVEGCPVTRRGKQESIQSAVRAACTVKCIATIYSVSFINDVFWEHVVLVESADHDVQELGVVFCQLTQKRRRRAKTSLKCLRVTQSRKLGTHPDRCYSCDSLLSDFLCFPNPNSIQDFDGIEEVVRGQNCSRVSRDVMSETVRL